MLSCAKGNVEYLEEFGERQIIALSIETIVTTQVQDDKTAIRT